MFDWQLQMSKPGASSASNLLTRPLIGSPLSVVSISTK